MKYNKSGFTLIELLVVVLIIGILAAIALPKYFRAVEKTRALQGIAAAKTLGEEAKRYYLFNNKYPQKFDQLDTQYNIKNIQMSGGYQGGAEKGVINGDFEVYLGYGYYRGIPSILLDRMADYNYRYVITYCLADGSMWCGAFVSALSNEEKERQLCQDIGGKLETPPAECLTSRIYNYRL